MKKILAAMLVFMSLMALCIFPSFAAGSNITSYAFADIAGTISGTTIDVYVPYSTVTTYWNHKVQVSDGAEFTAGAITQVDDRKATGTITVKGADGSQTAYTVNINKNAFVEPRYAISKARSVKKNSVKFDVTYEPNDAVVTDVRLVFYEKKSNQNYRTVDRTSSGIQEVEITGLKEGTRYTAYLEVKTKDKTYTTSGQSFTTKKAAESGTSSSSSSSSSSKNTTSDRGTNSDGANTTAKENKSKKNEWSLENDNWYYYGEDGFNKTGWFTVGDQTYYVEKGTNKLYMDMWKNIADKWYYFTASGALARNGWAFVNDKWYWMSNSGTMTQNQTVEVDGKQYEMAPDGTCLDGTWVIKDGRWQYYKAGAQGLARNEQFTVDGITYNADANGFVY